MQKIEFYCVISKKLVSKMDVLVDKKHSFIIYLRGNPFTFSTTKLWLRLLKGAPYRGLMSLTSLRIDDHEVRLLRNHPDVYDILKVKGLRRDQRDQEVENDW